MTAYEPRPRSADPAGTRVHRHAARAAACGAGAAVGAQLWQQGWLRKALIRSAGCVVEAIARWQDNDLLLPTFLQTAQAFAKASPAANCWTACGSLTVLLQGYVIGVLAAFGLTTLAAQPASAATCWKR
jgi:NitT/TauT family transport system permease protein